MMTRGEIVKELWKTERWGRGCQPILTDFADFLIAVKWEVGLEEAKVLDQNCVYFRASQPLTPQLAFKLGRLMSGGYPEYIDDNQTEFKLRWD